MEHVVAGRQAAPSWHTASASDREGFVTVLLERLEALHTPPKEMEPSQVLLALLIMLLCAGFVYVTNLAISFLILL